VPSPQLRVRSRRRRSRNAKDESFSDDEEEEEEEKKPPASPHMPCCPSTHDAITMDELPAKHICFFPPDGQSRECFSLETLRKIALTTSHPQFRTDLTGGGKVTFLQPPHFRAKMSDDLLDQIASRFGRDATDPRGAYFDRQQAAKIAEQLWSEPVEDRLQDRETFIERLERYVSNRMGSQDVYACPLCYIMAHKQLKGSLGDSSKKEKDELKRRYPTDFVHDPMTILGYLDNDEFRIASTFCFKTAAKLKGHLRDDHSVDTKMVEGNEAYTRYKVSLFGSVRVG